MPLELAKIPGYPTLGGAVTEATAAGAGEGTPIAIGDAAPSGPSAPVPRDNSGRTVCFTFTRDTLVGGKHTVYGRVNPTNDDAWLPILDLLTGAPVVDIAIEDGTGAVSFIYKLAADYRELRCDKDMDSGTVDCDFAMGS